MHARPPGLHESMRAHHVRMARAQQHTSHRPDRPSHTHSRASPSVLPQITPHRRDIQPTSWWRWRAPRSIEDIITNDCRARGVIGVEPVREQQRVQSRW